MTNEILDKIVGKFKFEKRNHSNYFLVPLSQEEESLFGEHELRDLSINYSVEHGVYEITFLAKNSSDLAGDLTIRWVESDYDYDLYSVEYDEQFCGHVCVRDVGSRTACGRYADSSIQICTARATKHENAVRVNAVIYVHKKDKGFADLAWSSNVRSEVLSSAKLTEITPQKVFEIDSHNVLTKYTGTSRKVVIPYGVVKIARRAFYKSDVARVIIPDTVEIIESEAFTSCDKLLKLNIPNGVKDIGAGAFKGCKSLVGTITLPNELKCIRHEVFCHCESVEEVVIPVGVEEIQDSAFSGCQSIKSLIIPDSVQIISKYAFSSCYNILSVKLPNGLTRIEEGLFASCSKLLQIEIPDDVISIGAYAFSHCNALSQIVLPKGLFHIGMCAFKGCSKIATIEIPDGVKKISNGAFMCCNRLNLIKLPQALTQIEKETFYDCGFVSFDVPSGVTSIGELAFGQCRKMTKVFIPKSVQTLDDNVFRYCSDKLTIFCESENCPQGWSEKWNSGERSVVWGYKN